MIAEAEIKRTKRLKGKLRELHSDYDKLEQHYLQAKRALELLKQLALDSLDITKSYNLTAIDVVNVVYQGLGTENEVSQNQEGD